MQRFLQFFANFLAELFPALPSPLFSSFQQGRHSLIIGPETCLTETTPKPGAVPLKLQNVSILDALDFLSLQTESFWELVDGSTIAVAPGNHRSFSRSAFRRQSALRGQSSEAVASKNQHVSTGGTRALLQARKQARSAEEQEKSKDRNSCFVGLNEKTSVFDL